MAKLLTNLKISEVSSVDRGAGEGVRLVLMKRNMTAAAPGGDDAAVVAYLKRNYFAELEARYALEKRKFSAKQRRRDASSGVALPDGSFPIENEEDLKNAIRAVGRASDPAKAKAHIRARARSMGLSSLLPDSWKSSKKRVEKELRKIWVASGQKLAKGYDFNLVQAGAEAQEWADGMGCELDEALCSLRRAWCSIMCDDAVTDKMAALTESYQQFQQHLGGLVPEGVEQAIQGAKLVATGARINPQGAVIGKETTTMMTDVEKGQLTAAQTLAKDLEAKLKAEKKRRQDTEGDLDDMRRSRKKAKKRLDAVLGMSASHLAYAKHEDVAMTGDDLIAFIDMSAEKRDAYIKANPLEGALAKRLDDLPEPVRKELEQAKADREDRTKRDDAAQLQALTKRATELGLPATVGEHLQKMAKAAPESFEAAMAVVKQQIEALAEQANTGALFKTFGDNRGGEASAQAQVKTLVEGLQKSDSSIKTFEQGVAKIARMPEHRELFAQYKVETSTPTQRAA